MLNSPNSGLSNPIIAELVDGAALGLVPCVCVCVPRSVVPFFSFVHDVPAARL